LPIERRVEHRVPPKRKLNARILLNGIEDFLPWNRRYPTAVECRLWLLVVGAIAVLGTPRPNFERH
jgi:hypothetical protein